MKLRFPHKSFMPIGIDVGQKKVLIIGGGRIALQKVQVLSHYAKNIVVIASEIKPEIKSFSLAWKEKNYNVSDLKNAFLVYACTNIPTLNRQIFHDCQENNILINVVDNPELCDFVTPAIYRKGYVSVAVTSNAQSVMKSIEIRNTIKHHLENDPNVFI
jgi:siroheme synthase-like protein